MIQSAVLLEKEDPNIPDYYEIEKISITGKSEKIKVASHRIVDKVYNHRREERKIKQKNIEIIDGFEREIWIETTQLGDYLYDSNNNPIMDCVGALAVPFVEYVTFDNKWGWFPLSSVSDIKFDSNFSKLIEIKESKEKQKLLNKIESLKNNK